MLPKDPYILFSVVNTKLRDSGCTLSEFCKAEGIVKEELTAKMKSISMCYDEENNCFRRI